MKKFLCIITALLLCMVLPIGTSYAAPGDIIVDDFEDYAEGTELTAISDKFIVVKGAAGSSVTVEKDEVNDTKAIKVTQTKQTPAGASSTKYTGFQLVLGKKITDTVLGSIDGVSTRDVQGVTEGILEIDFKMRIEGDVTATLSWDLFHGNNATKVTSFLGVTQNEGMVYSYQSPGQGAWVEKLNKDQYTNFHIEIDMNNKTNQSITMTCDPGDGGSVISVKPAVSITGIKDIDILNLLIGARNNATKSAAGGSSTPGLTEGATNDPVYWIDDLNVRVRAIGVTDATPVDEATDVEIDTDVVTTFNAAPDETDLNAKTQLFLGDSEVSKDLYEISVADKKATLTMKDKFEYNSDYKFVINEGLTSTEPGHLPLGSKLETTFKTKRMFDACANVEDGKVYGKVAPVLPANPMGDLTATLTKPDGTTEDFVSGTLLEELGDYTLTITGTDTANNKTQTDVLNFEVIGEQPPQALDVEISVKGGGDIKPTSTLVGSYKFFDLNDDKELTDKTTFKWYYLDTAENKYKEIEGETTKELQLKEEYYNKYLKFEVIPVSDKEPSVNDTEEFVRADFASYFLPVAKDVKIEGTVALDKTITATYEWFDENKQEKKDPAYVWYRSTDDGKTYKAIEKATSETYTITKDDMDCKIKVGVTPKKATGDGVETFSSEVYGLMSPKASDVKLNGRGKVGQTLYVSYVYSDINDDKEADTEIVWYADGSVIGKGESLQIKDKYEGDSVYAVVTPKSENYPFEGEAVETDSVKISASSSDGGSSHSPSYSVSKPSTPTTPTTPVTPPADDNPPAPTFSDVETHWAKADILTMHEKGVIDGVGDGLFSPDTNVTRAQFAKMISKIFTKNDGANEVNVNDVEEGAWYNEFVEYVVKNGLMSGSNGNFRPNDYITREEICVVILNGMKATAVETESGFADAGDISDWAKDGVNYAFANGIINGKGDNVFAPKSNATRAECMVMLLRLMNMMEG